MTRPVRPKLTIVTPVYNESENLDRYASAIEQFFSGRADLEVSIILVDDGSTDNSWEKIEQFVRGDRRYSGVRLSRNFGSHVALAASFDRVSAEADMVAILACDLQDPPQVVLEMVEEWRRGADVVWGGRRSRGDAFWRRTASRLLESTLRRFAMPRSSKFRTGSFLLMDSKVLDCVKLYNEHHRVTFALVAWAGFEQAVVEYDREQRRAGNSGWSLGRMLSAAYDVFIGFSPVPAKFVTALGFIIFCGSVVALIALVVEWMVRDVQPGWTGIMAAMTIMFGVLFMMVGVIVEYLYRIFIESKRRPLYFVARTAGSTSGESSEGSTS